MPTYNLSFKFLREVGGRRVQEMAGRGSGFLWKGEARFEVVLELPCISREEGALAST